MTQQKYMHYKLISYMAIITVFSSYNNIIAQSSKSLKLVNNNDKTIIKFKENTRIKIKTFHTDKIIKYKGNLKIINDSIIAIDSVNINIDSIYKIGKIPFLKQFFGHYAAIGGVGITGLGVYFFKEAGNTNNNILESFLYLFVGASLVSTGVPLAIISEYIAHGSMRNAKNKKRHLKIG